MASTHPGSFGWLSQESLPAPTPDWHLTPHIRDPRQAPGDSLGWGLAQVQLNSAITFSLPPPTQNEQGQEGRREERRARDEARAVLGRKFLQLPPASHTPGLPQAAGVERKGCRNKHLSLPGCLVLSQEVS